MNISWLKRKPRAITMREDVMVSWFRGDEMVEAGFMKMIFTIWHNSAKVGVAEPTSVSLPGGVDRAVYEFPWGCFERDMDPTKGAGTWTWVPDTNIGQPGNISYRQCQRMHQAVISKASPPSSSTNISP